MYEQSLGWVFPALTGLILGWGIHLIIKVGSPTYSKKILQNLNK